MRDGIAVYPGTFDPFTRGMKTSRPARVAALRQDRRRRRHQRRQGPIFTMDERVEIARRCWRLPQRRSEGFSCLLMEFLRQNNARVILRGLRAVSDFEYEFQMAGMNRKLYPDVETVFLTPAEEFMFISATMVREIARLGGDVSKFVQPSVNGGCV